MQHQTLSSLLQSFFLGEVQHQFPRGNQFTLGFSINPKERGRFTDQAANITMRDVSAVVNYYQDKAQQLQNSSVGCSCCCCCCCSFFHLNMTIPWNNCSVLRHVPMRQYRIQYHFATTWESKTRLMSSDIGIWV